VPPPNDGPTEGSSSTPETRRQWSVYEDMLVDESADAIPVFGVRIVVFTDPEGQESVRWSIEGDPQLNESVAVLERTKFLMMFNAQIAEDEDD